MAFETTISTIHFKPKPMNDFSYTLSEIKTHLKAISNLITASEFKSDQDEDLINNLNTLSNQNDSSIKEFAERLSNFIWSYDKIRIYFVNQKELFKRFLSRYNAIIQLRNDLQVVPVKTKK